MLAGCSGPGRLVRAVQRQHQQLLALLGLGPFGTYLLAVFLAGCSVCSGRPLAPGEQGSS